MICAEGGNSHTLLSIFPLWQPRAHAHARPANFAHHARSLPPSSPPHPPSSLARRESADPKRIADRHKKMLIANHPDVGGSTFIAGKINEAKDVLLGKGVSKTGKPAK